MMLRGFITTLALLLSVTASAHQVQQEQILKSVDFEQHIGREIPGDIHFTDVSGKRVSLAGLAGQKPLLLVMSWFNCPNLCPMLLDRLATTASGLSIPSGDYHVAVISISAAEGPKTAADTRKRVARSHENVSLDNWHFLTGDQDTIDRLADTVGFKYTYDDKRDRYAHPAGITVIAPDNHINRYLFGITPESRDIKLALLQASHGKLGSPTDQLLLRCYRYDPQSGRYSLAVMNLLRIAGGGSVVLLAGLIVLLRRREQPS